VSTKPKPKAEAILMGNEAIARGLVENGVHLVSAYPGTPSSEILPSVVRFAPEADPPPYCEWSVNEKVALEVALSAAYTGKRTACAMKQVGLNVALDPVMSSAYIGVKGGFIIISADDPGPHSSQTEQDSRLLAHFAKLPVLDPDSPAQARDLVATAFSISERFEIPVMIRPVLRVCHARQNLTLRQPKSVSRPASFVHDPFRWAAIPKMRLALHHALNDKLVKIADYAGKQKKLNIWHAEPGPKKARLGILASGLPAALARDLLAEMGIDPKEAGIPFLQVAMPYPLPILPVQKLLNACGTVLVLEETEPVLEMLSPERSKLLGRYSGHVPSAGELGPDVLGEVLENVFKLRDIKLPKPKTKILSVPDQAPLRRPNLCPGCAHRAVFWAMKRNFPGGIFPSDIGCYTLGLNQGAVDTCHDMGAAINFAAALSRSHQMDGIEKPVIATIGDSTFYHSGAAGLISSVYNGARFVLVILDNETTSMTGMQPTPENGLTADGHPGRKVDIMRLIKGCGVEQVEEVDPYDLKALAKALKKAHRFAAGPDGSVAVIVARHACVAQRKDEAIPNPVPIKVAGYADKKPPVHDRKAHKCADCGRCVEICPTNSLTRTAKGVIKVNAKTCTGCRLCAEVCPTGTMTLEPAHACVGCGVCTTLFVCPALKPDAKGHISIDPSWCVDCGLCQYVCAHGALIPAEVTS
jgi:indolepyruvate ferredoxin oxidoreductase alpha subunit